MTTTETEAAEATETETAAAPAKPAAGDLTKIVDRAPTGLHQHYWGWLKEKTGVDLDVTDEVAIKIVQISVSLYQKYQASDENKQRREDERLEREKAALEAKAAKEAKAKEAAAAKEKAKAEAEAEAAAAGEGDAPAKRQPPPRKGKQTPAQRQAATEAPF